MIWFKVAVYEGGAFFGLLQQKAPARRSEAAPITHTFACVILSRQGSLPVVLSHARLGGLGLLKIATKSVLACCIA